MTTGVSEGIGKLLWVMIGFLPVYGVGRVFLLKYRAFRTSTKLRVDWAREIALALFALFMLGLLVLTFENDGNFRIETNPVSQAIRRLKTGEKVNFVPFRTIRRYLKFTNRGEIMVNIVGNIVMFLPWGLGLLLLWKKNRSFLKLTILSLFLPLSIEFIQLFIGRAVDMDDVILNFTGSMLGGLAYFILTRAFPGLKKLAR